MPNIASVLKDEIARIARKEIRSHTDPLKKAANGYRSEIAALKRRTNELERALKRQANGRAVKVQGPDEASQDSANHRFSAKGLKSHRERLELSAADIGLLVGASGQSVYKWEEGEGRPRAQYMKAISAVRAMGKREATARLAQLKAAGKADKSGSASQAGKAAPAKAPKKPRRKVAA